ncbi:MAG: type II toxin-antitoxin system HicB family antitoxin [Lachnospiraceae bacterium]|nr:type II toxin-antitoxin system HicB family antitoxin [Lachnospiraceae bacterium]
MLSMYPACFFEEENGHYSVVFPDLNYLATSGDSFEEAMTMAVDCLAGYLRWCSEDGDTIPEPSGIMNIDVDAVARDIGEEEMAASCIVNIVSVDVEAYAKQHFDKSVRKTLTIPAWLNSAAMERGINFSQTLQEALLSKVQSDPAIYK